jgi:hypothetical protein
MRVSLGGAEAVGAKGLGLAALIRRVERGPRRPRRTGVSVEAIESRVALSGVTSQALGAIRGVGDPNERRAVLVASYEDPNQLHAAAVRTFNPQPDPPAGAARIIPVEDPDQ